jgi:hypothetical protein
VTVEGDVIIGSLFAFFRRHDKEVFVVGTMGKVMELREVGVGDGGFRNRG